MPSAATLERFIARVEENAHVEAVQEFYTEHATMQENLDAPRVGRAAHVANEQRVMARAKHVSSTCVRPVFVHGDYVVIRWIFRFEWQDGSITRMEELAYQRWEGERIAQEQFFYDPAQRVPRKPPADATNWEQRVAQLWQTIDQYAPDEFVARIEALANELPMQDAAALFERACAQDSTGHSDRAVPLYRAALAAGLSGLRRRRATIQLASSLRNVSDAHAAVALLQAELTQPADELDGAVRAFLALALADVGREREALAHGLTALSRYLPRYNQSLARYANSLVNK